MMNMAFEPFLAYELVDQPMADKLHHTMKSYRACLEDFIGDEEADVEKARELLRAMEGIEETHRELSDEIYRIPSIVHIAGEKKEESNPDNAEETAIIQRCSRCGSLLQFWYEGLMYVSANKEVKPLDEEETRWWDVGQQLAKHDVPGATDIYAIKEDRPLERWEHECADLSGLENIFDVG
jgi:hypothetical protein